MTTFHLTQSSFHILTPIPPRGFLQVNGWRTSDDLFGIDFIPQRAWPYNGYWPRGFNVVHLASGRGLGPIMQTRDECIGFIEQVRGMTDWSDREPDLSGGVREHVDGIIETYNEGRGMAAKAWTEKGGGDGYED